MNKLFTAPLLWLLLSVSAFGQDQCLSSALYPNSVDEQDFVNTFMKVVENHKNGLDPLMGGSGPSISRYQIDKMKFAFIREAKDGKVDLVLFNWNLEVFDGLEKDEDLSKLYGKDVYILKGLDPEMIASQGENNDQLTNFSYILGANTYAESVRVKYPGITISDEFANWKPHPKYMDRTHPLRKALNAETLVLLSPSEKLFKDQFGPSEEAKAYYDQMVKTKGGFKKIMNGVMVHEMFHIKENQDQTLGLVKEREDKTDRKQLAKELEDRRLVELLSSYTGLVFKIGRDISANDQSKKNLESLSVVIDSIKSEYPNAWNYIWNYEYTEGFAEYASAQSLVDAKLFTLPEIIDLEIKDTANNIAYRTGTLGGLYLRNNLKIMPFANQEDHSKSVWELVIEQEKVQSSGEINKIVEKNKLPDDEFQSEIDAIKEYLTSTVQE